MVRSARVGSGTPRVRTEAETLLARSTTVVRTAGVSAAPPVLAGAVAALMRSAGGTQGSTPAMVLVLVSRQASSMLPRDVETLFRGRVGGRLSVGELSAPADLTVRETPKHDDGDQESPGQSPGPD